MQFLAKRFEYDIGPSASKCCESDERHAVKTQVHVSIDQYVNRRVTVKTNPKNKEIFVSTGQGKNRITSRKIV